MTLSGLEPEEATFKHRTLGAIDSHPSVIQGGLDKGEREGFHGTVNARARGILGDHLDLFERQRGLHFAVVSGDEHFLALTGADEEPLAKLRDSRFLDDAPSALGDLATTDDLHEATSVGDAFHQDGDGVEQTDVRLLAKRATGGFLVRFREVDFGLLATEDFGVKNKLAVHEFGRVDEGEVIPDIGHNLHSLGFGRDGEDNGLGGGIHSGLGIHSFVVATMTLPNPLGIAREKVKIN